MKTWDEMEPRERNAWVAENVMRWQLRGNEFDGYWWHGAAVLTRPASNSSWMGMVWEPTTSAECDCLVLVRVREKWGAKRCSELSRELISMWSERRQSTMDRPLSYADHMMYQPGDYSHAAYLALTGSER